MGLFEPQPIQFCEAVLFGRPEYVNAFSSVAMIAWGLPMLLLAPTQSLFAKLIASLLVTNGVGSFFFHWTGYPFWGYFDFFPMALGAVLSVQVLADMVLFQVFRDRTPRLYQLLSGAAFGLTMSYALLALILRTDPAFKPLRPLLFFLPLLVVFVLMLVVRFWTHTEFVADHPRLFRLAQRALLFGVAAALIWLATELNCKDAPWLGYLHAHVLWHFGVTYSLVVFAQLIVYLQAPALGYVPSVDWRRRGSRLLPVVRYL